MIYGAGRFWSIDHEDIDSQHIRSSRFLSDLIFRPEVRAELLAAQAGELPDELGEHVTNLLGHWRT